MKAYLINMHLLVPKSRSSAKVKVKYKDYISQKMAVLGAFVFHKHIFFFSKKLLFQCRQKSGLCGNGLTLSQRQILDSSKLKVFAYNNVKLDENDIEVSKR